MKKTPKVGLPKSESYGVEKSNSECTNKNIETYIFEGSLEFKEDDSKVS